MNAITSSWQGMKDIAVKKFSFMEEDADEDLMLVELLIFFRYTNKNLQIHSRLLSLFCVPRTQLPHCYDAGLLSQ